VFTKESSEFRIIYVRRQAADLPTVWVITFSATQRESRHLYRRDGVMADKRTPPMLGWSVYPGGDGLEHALEQKLGDAPGRLEYFPVYDRKTTSGDDGKLSPRAGPRQDGFRSDTHCMQLCIVGASHLQTASDVEPEAYCASEIPGKLRVSFQTPPKHASFNPFWRHIIEVEKFEKDDVLIFSVRSVDNVLLGQASLEYSKIFPKGSSEMSPLRYWR